MTGAAAGSSSRIGSHLTTLDTMLQQKGKGGTLQFKAKVLNQWEMTARSSTMTQAIKKVSADLKAEFEKIKNEMAADPSSAVDKINKCNELYVKLQATNKGLGDMADNSKVKDYIRDSSSLKDLNKASWELQESAIELRQNITQLQNNLAQAMNAIAAEDFVNPGPNEPQFSNAIAAIKEADGGELLIQQIKQDYLNIASSNKNQADKDKDIADLEKRVIAVHDLSNMWGTLQRMSDGDNEVGMFVRLGGAVNDHFNVEAYKGDFHKLYQDIATMIFTQNRLALYRLLAQFKPGLG